MIFSLGGTWADSDTAANGETSFSAPLAAGGWTEGPVWVYLNGERAVHPDMWGHPPVPLRFNSADINADGRVDINDVVLFAADVFGGYAYRSDFRWDGVLDLTDLALLAKGLGRTCE